MLLDQVLDVQNLALVFLLAILAIVGHGRVLAGALCQLRQRACLQLLLPAAALHADHRDPESVVALGFFLVVGVIASNLTARVQRQAVAASQRARTTDDLYPFSRKLAGTGTLDDVLWATAFQIASMLKVRVVLLLARRRLDRRQGRLSAGRHAGRCRHRRRPLGLGARPSRRARGRYPAGGQAALPAAAHRARRRRRRSASTTTAPGPLLHARPAAPVRRPGRSGRGRHRAHPAGRRRRPRASWRPRRTALRSALLTSISHDLKTPLAAILGAAGTLKDYGASMSEPDRTRASGHGDRRVRTAQPLHRQPARHDPDRIRRACSPNYGPARHRATSSAPPCAAPPRSSQGHRVETELAADLPMVTADSGAVRTGSVQPARQRRQVCRAGHVDPDPQLGRGPGPVVLQVLDEGPGIPPRSISSTSSTASTGCARAIMVRAGTGLGLSICRGFRRGDGRNHHRRQPHRPDRRGLHDPAAAAGEAVAGEERR